jgi:hypothetical protein
VAAHGSVGRVVTAGAVAYVQMLKRSIILSPQSNKDLGGTNHTTTDFPNGREQDKAN